MSGSAEAKQRIEWLRNLGDAGETTAVTPGIKGKMNEFSAPVGLLDLRHIKHVAERRQEIDRLDRDRLRDADGLRLLGQDLGERVSNYAYFPILVGPAYPISRGELSEALRARGIAPRRYFYPLIPEFPMYRGLPSAGKANLPVATRTSRQILCLRLQADLAPETAAQIFEIIVDQATRR